MDKIDLSMEKLHTAVSHAAKEVKGAQTRLVNTYLLVKGTRMALIEGDRDTATIMKAEAVMLQLEAIFRAMDGINMEEL